jgi:two-component system sensor histidine kinase KdpD
LRRTPDARRPDWVRIRGVGHPAERGAAEHLYRVAISAGTDAIGSIWALLRTTIDPPNAAESRLLAATADAIAQSVVRGRLATQATELEIAQRSDELKSALLDSVSHDMRTPLAAIRAAAGSLADPAIEWTDEDRVATAAQIDAEVQRLNRIVGNLLDMGRIQAGALRPELVMLPVEDAIRDAVAHSMVAIRDHPLEIEVRPDLPPVVADAVMLQEALVNLFENVGRHAPAGATMRVTAEARDGRLRLSVEDAGHGLPGPALDRVFERFYQAPTTNPGSRRGTGLGLAVVRGMVEAMGGTVSARPSELGGLAIDLDLPSASTPQLSEHSADVSD